MDTITMHPTLTVARAAEALGVSERTVWRYLKSGRLPGETAGPPGGQRTLIPADAVEALRHDRGDDPQATALRSELERVAADLAAARAERDALRSRVGELQRALARPAPAGPLGRALGRALAAAARPRRGLSEA